MKPTAMVTHAIFLMATVTLSGESHGGPVDAPPQATAVVLVAGTI